MDNPLNKLLIYLWPSKLFSRWWVFRSWGRIGTTIGNDKLEETEDLNDAIAQFDALYEEKTGNRFTAKEFKKVPGCWYPLDIDYGQVSNGSI